MLWWAVSVVMAMAIVAINVVVWFLLKGLLARTPVRSDIPWSKLARSRLMLMVTGVTTGGIAVIIHYSAHPLSMATAFVLVAFVLRMIIGATFNSLDV